jgi:DDE family transposase
MSPRVRLRTWREGAHGQCVKTNLDTLATALYARIDDELKASPWLAPWRPKVGIEPTLSDAELLTLVVMSALLGYTSERRWLRRVDRDFRGMFPYVPRQSGYGKRLRAASSLLTSMIRVLAQDTSLWSDDVWLVDSTPVGCGCSRETAKRSDLAGWAQYGYCASHSRYFWGLRLHLVCTLGGLPILFALTGAKADERETLRDMLDTAPDVTAAHPGQTIIGDKNYYGREFENDLTERDLMLLASPSGPAHTCSSRCVRSSSRSTRPSKGSSTWNDTAARPRPESPSGSCRASSR